MKSSLRAQQLPRSAFKDLAPVYVGENGALPKAILVTPTMQIRLVFHLDFSFFELRW
jgi:hypothetical protein